ncbi:hypothetical protein T35B1_01370 [Salinisphaera shabanensis T35B1]
MLPGVASAAADGAGALAFLVVRLRAVAVPDLAFDALAVLLRVDAVLRLVAVVLLAAVLLLALVVAFLALAVLRLLEALRLRVADAFFDVSPDSLPITDL